MQTLPIDPRSNLDRRVRVVRVRIHLPAGQKAKVRVTRRAAAAAPLYALPEPVPHPVMERTAC